MRSSRVGFAAFAATVSLCVFSAGVTGAVVVDGLLGQGALAAEQGVKPGGFGSGGALGGGSAAAAGQAGVSGGDPGTEALEPGAGTAAGASSNDRAVDRTLGIGRPQGKGLGAGAAGGGAKDAGDETGKAGATALGKAADKQEDKAGEPGTVDAKDKDADGALEPQAMSAMAATSGSSSSGSSLNAPEKPSIPEITGNGFFTQKIGIDVPAFRGLEPKLSLAYSSARKTRLGGLYQGWLGYAWGLDGFDVIERATPGYGYPAFDAKDVYLLNGEELVACTTGMVAASCSAGGTHVTENENFKRVIFDATANTWTVTDRDGTVSLFRSVMAVAGSTPASGTPEYKVQHDGRFLLSSVTDTNGNVVSYAYTCPDLPVCYPSVVSYGGMSVNFHYEARPDFLVMANGLGLSYTKQRIRTIAVKVGTALRAAYTLTYDQAPFSNTSRLVKVDRYGRDATVTAAGVVTGPTVKNIRQMTYDNANFTYAPQQVTQLIGTYPTGTFVGGTNFDADFDGQDESFQIYDENLCPECGEGNPSYQGGGHRYHLAFTKLLGPNLTTQSVLTSTLPALTDIYGSTPGSLKWLLGRHTTANVKDIVIASSSPKFDWGSEVVTRWQDFVYKVGPDWTLTLEGCAGPSFVTVCNTAPHEAPSLTGLVSLDFDGDGIDDIAYVGGDTPSSVGDFAANGRQSLLLLHPSSLVLRNVDGAWIGASAGPNCQAPIACRLGDINGDGTTDLVYMYNSNAVVWLSTGTGFAPVGALSLNSESSLRDFDNDGKFEFTHDQIVVSGIGFGPAGIQHLLSNYVIPKGYWAAGDFNGDGLPEVSGDITLMSQAGSGNPNLLRSVKLETGGVVSVDYTPSTRWTNVFMPQVLHAVTQLRVDDGRGQVAATDYAYAGGLYDPKARKFLGYKTITMTKPLANGETARPVVETTYRQDLASYGLPEKTVIRNGANTASKTVTETYAVNAATKPYTSLNTATETTLNETGTPLVLRKERAFDAYGNITQIKDYGRKDLTGDETWTLASYAPNTTAYIVSLPRQRNVRSGGFSTSTDVFEQHQALYYDGSTDNAAPPTKGNLTILRSYKSVEPTDTSYLEYFTYDPANGNKLSHVDGAGSRTEWDYDTVYKLYVVAERAPKYFATGGQPADARFVSTFTNDVVCGKPATKVDWNGVTETFTYDPFCRPYDYTHSGSGKYVKTRYENEGNPASQAVVSYEPLSTGTGDVFTRTFYDGLGRPWRVQTPGETASGQRRITDTSYDARGNVGQTAFARFADETAQWTVNSYDWQDRVVKTVNPDASQRTYLYLVQTTTFPGSSNLPVMEMRMTDEEGKPHRTFTDKDNNVILTSPGQLAGAWVNEYRSYDVVGRLKGVRDNDGATWIYTYDLVGNRLSASDPDLGTWTYTYDNANRLVSQTDARGAVTTLSYDQMGRLLTKQVKAAGETTATVTATNTYDQTREGYIHNVGLLTSSENGNAKLEYWRNYNGAGGHSVVGATINGQPYWRTQAMGRQWKPERTMYGPVSVNIGTTAPYWVYNSADLLYSIPDYITSTFYEADGQTKSISYANGVTTEFAYSPTRRWLTRVTTKKGTTVLMDNQYTRDKLGRIKTITGLTPADSWTYAYDDLDRLISADNAGNNALDESYSYSATGNLLSRTRISGSYTYPVGTAIRPHAATKIGTKTIGYDANGNMISDGTRSLVWDRSNQLASVTQGGSAVTFSYGADGSRVMKNWAFGKTLYAGADIEIDRTTPGAEVYTYYPHPDLKIVATAAGAISKFFLHRDHLSSVRLVTDAAGNVAEQTSYAAYGETTNPAMQTKKGYIGERFDVETGLMYLNARYYDPAFGRFIEKDDEADMGQEADRQCSN